MLELSCQLWLHGWFSLSSTLKFQSPQIQRSALHTGLINTFQITNGRTRAPLSWIKSLGNSNNLRPTLPGLDSWGFLPKPCSWTLPKGHMRLPAWQAMHDQFEVSLPKIPYGPQRRHSHSYSLMSNCFSPFPSQPLLTYDLIPASFTAKERNLNDVTSVLLFQSGLKEKPVKFSCMWQVKAFSKTVSTSTKSRLLY